MNDDLRDRLRRLGVVKGARDLKPIRPPRPAPEPPPEAFTLAQLLPGGRVVHNDYGGYFVVDHVYPASASHGTDRLDALGRYDGGLLARYDTGAPALLQAADCLFLDTETTGLAGTGTVAFMVGVGYFDGAALVVRQYFMRDHGDEAALLTDLAALAAGKSTLLTFNGRTFDVPLLQGRYLMNRLDAPFDGLHHVDLLHVARRLWRPRLGSVALSALETNLLDVSRTVDDVPGWQIPALYHDYLRSGDAREIARVFYHNRIDIISMVTLTARVLALLAAPQAWPHAVDVLALAQWQMRLGWWDSAESLLRHTAAADQLALDVWHTALTELGRLLKRHDRRHEAVVYWQQIAFTTDRDVDAHVELAKYFEWHAGDLDRALRWTLDALERCPPHDAVLRHELLHRLERLERKRGGDPAA